jgi:adenosine deaminase
MSNKTDNFLRLPWPKNVTEIHVHLGGSVPLYRLWEIAVERGIRGLGVGYEEFIRRHKIDDGRVRDLDTYLDVYDTLELIQSGPAAIRESMIIAIHRAYRTGGMIHLGPGGEEGSLTSLFSVARLELRFNPLKRTGAVSQKGKYAGLYDVDRVIKSACDAIEEVEIAFHGKIQVGLLFCFGRDMTVDANRILAEKTAAWSARSKKIIGVDLAGPESVNPLSSKKDLDDMASVFSIIPQRLGRTIHVGETPHVSLETFLNTVEAISPQRVAHPIVAFRAYWEKKDDRGLKLLKERGLVCEFCVKSNLLTKAVKDISEYKRIIDTADKFQIPYTFSTDAPSLQVTSLAEELMLLLEHDAARFEQILRAIETAESCSFLEK